MPVGHNRRGRSTAAGTARPVFAAIGLFCAVAVGVAAVIATTNDTGPVAGPASSAAEDVKRANGNAGDDSATSEAAEPRTIETRRTIRARAQRRATSRRADDDSAQETDSPTTPAPTNAPTSDASPSPKSPPPATPKPQPTPTQAPAPPAGGGGMSATEAEVMRLTNAERRKAGCGSLTASSQLTQAARGHSRDMVDNGYFSHSGRDGSSAGDRIERVGYRWRTYGENIAQGQTSAQSVMSGWMNSSGHRANILNCSFTQIGVGLSRGSSGGGPMTWTQVFGAPR